MKAESKINSVTVYKDRAMVERKAEANLAQGEHLLIFNGIPPQIDINSIQVRGGNECVLLEIKTTDVYLDEIPDETKKSLVTEIVEIESLIEEATDRANNLNEEKLLLQKMANISSESPKKAFFPLLVPEKVQEMLKFYRDKLNQIDDAIRLNKKDLFHLNEQLGILKSKKKGFNQNSAKTEKQIQIRVFASQETKTTFFISYMVYNTGWKPCYDFRLNSDEKKISVSYSALISQNTGEKWENVKISLSTAKPQISARQPELNTWFVDVYLPPKVYAEESMDYRAASPMALGKSMKMNDFDEEYAAAPVPVAEAQVEQGATAFNFSLPGLHDIPDNNEEHKKGIASLSFDAELKYQTIPKLSHYAYLTAEAINNSDYPLLAGMANIFLDNTFVANSAIKLVAPGELFKISLGIDESVKIEHNLVNRYTKDEGLFSKKNKIIFEYRITISNNKKIDCPVKILDQIPVSQNQDIKVEIIEPKIKENNPGLQKNDNGIIEWNHLISPGEKVNIALKFSLEYPKEITVSGID